MKPPFTFPYKDGVPAAALFSGFFLWTMLGVITFAPFLWMYLPVGGGLDHTGYRIGHDFINVWTAAKITLEGKVAVLSSQRDYLAEMMRLTGLDLRWQNFSYPPHLLLLIFVFGLLPYFPALALWTAAGAAAAAAALRSSGRLKEFRRPMLLFLLSPAAIANVIAGQNGFFTAALFLGGLYLGEKKPARAGALIGLLTVKPHLGILLPFVLLIRRNWKCFVAAALAALLLGGSSVLFWGVGPWLDFCRETLPFQGSLLQARHGIYAEMMPGIYATVLMLPAPGALVRAYFAALHVAASIFALAVCFRALRRDGVTPRSVLILSIATIIILPYCFNYDMLMVAGALTAYFCTVKKLPAAAFFYFGLLWILPLAVTLMKLLGLAFSGLILLAALTAADGLKEEA